MRNSPRSPIYPCGTDLCWNLAGKRSFRSANGSNFLSNDEQHTSTKMPRVDSESKLLLLALDNGLAKRLVAPVMAKGSYVDFLTSPFTE